MIIYRHKKYGFTLIELSVVLVIIGLIIGGVMTGKVLIESGKIRAQLTQIADIETQINTFRVKYNCLPGDCPNATSFLGTTYGANTVLDGDGDGIIRSIYAYGVAHTAGECTRPDATGEVSQLLMQLTATGLGKYMANGSGGAGAPNAIVGREYTYSAYDNSTGLFVSCLASSANPTYTPPFFRNGNIIVFGAAGSSVGRIGYVTGTLGIAFYGAYGAQAAGPVLLNPIGIPADAVRQMDEKIDDGKPSSGKFGIINGDTACAANATAYPAPDVYCRVTAGKRISN